jgi:threonine 3-dehydrogenase
MLAVRKVAPRPGAEACTIDVPAVGPMDVLVDVRAASICGTDRHVYHWDAWAQGRVKPPLTFGHECAGVVAEVGPLVTSVAPGDLVSVETHIPCQRCRACRTGLMHVCERLQILGVDREGCFAEKVVIPEICAWKNPGDMDPRVAAIQEPFGNAVYCVDRAQVPLKTVAIMGDGPIACFAAAIARAQGACLVVVVGLSPTRLRLASRMGAHHVVNAREAEVVEALLALSGKEGFDVVLEVAGAAATIRQGFRVLRRGGTFIAFGLTSGPVSVDFNDDVIFKEARVLGLNGRRMFETWYQTQALISRGLVDPSPVITHAFTLEEHAKAFDLLDDPDGVAGKIVLLPGRPR